MAALDFPSNPNLHEIYEANGRKFLWNGISWSPALLTGTTGRNMQPFPLGLEYGHTSVASGAASVSLGGNTYVHHTTGSFFAVVFRSPETQVNGDFTLHALVTSRTGSPTDLRLSLYDGPSGVMDPQRPKTGPPIATSGAVDATLLPANDRWATFTLSNVTLTRGLTYFAVVWNNTPSPGSNFVNILHQGWYPFEHRFRGLHSTGGFAYDASIANYEPTAVMKFASGALMGNPFVLAKAVVSNTGPRGNRYVFDYDVTVAGIQVPVPGITTWDGVQVYQVVDGLPVLILSMTLDLHMKQNGGGWMFPEDIKMRKGLPYIVAVSVASSTAGWLTGMSAGLGDVPADVLACMPNIHYVSAATVPELESTKTPGFTNIRLIVKNVG